MTRAIGCYHLRTQGVIPLPSIKTHAIDAANDAALVLATGTSQSIPAPLMHRRRGV